MKEIRGQGKWKSLDFLRFTIFENIEKCDHIHFCSLEAKDQSSSQLSLFPGDILVPGAGPKEPNVPPAQKVGWKVVDCV